MTPAARLSATIEILEKISTSRIPMDSVVGDYMRVRRYIGSKDRAAIAERTYKIIRARARLHWWLERSAAAVTARTMALAWLALGEGMQAPYIEKLFNGAKYSPASLDEAERTLLAALDGQKLEPADMPDAVRVECPPGWEDAMRARFGDDFVPEMRAMMDAAPLDLRVNTLRTTRDGVLGALQKDGIAAAPTRWSPSGIRLAEKVHLSKTKVFTKGLVEIQDEGSQLIAHLCGAQAGMQVLDFCAGAGGKTLALAAGMENKGRIVATDIAEARLQKARPRFKRAGVHDIIEVRPLSDEKNRKWLRRQKGTFDVVLTDVPCSGSGTWRRNPDMRWTQYGPDLAELLVVQAEILDRAAKAVKDGGRLVYATCSVLADENEHQVEQFLARNPDFTAVPLAEVWDGEDAPCDGPYMRLTPHQHNTDGFFAAILQKSDHSVTLG